jgi:hypothetical protein
MLSGVGPAGLESRMGQRTLANHPTAPLAAPSKQARTRARALRAARMSASRGAAFPFPLVALLRRAAHSSDAGCQWAAAWSMRQPSSVRTVLHGACRPCAPCASVAVVYALPCGVRQRRVGSRSTTRTSAKCGTTSASASPSRTTARSRTPLPARARAACRLGGSGTHTGRAGDPACAQVLRLQLLRPGGERRGHCALRRVAERAVLAVWAGARNLVYAGRPSMPARRRIRRGHGASARPRARCEAGLVRFGRGSRAQSK